ncbi:MAG: prolyl oligopeptidase family serine peptidase [Planctomycetaceae bacterium]|nr:prolyl oligopeptidase family serine peptidase [Planctomycetaceae bacterium]
MAIETQCRCGRVVKVRDELKGKNIRCPECKEVMVVKPRRLPRMKKKTPAVRRRGTAPSAASAASFDAFSAPASPTRRAKPKPKPKPKPKRKRRRERPPESESHSSGGYGTLSTVGLVLLSILGFGLKLTGRLHRISRLNSPSSSTVVSEPDSLSSSGSMFSGLLQSLSLVQDPFDLSDVSVPDFPELPPVAMSVSGVDIHQFSLDGDTSVPGSRMTMRVYIPQGAPADHSRTCVLVAPAGTNLMTGNQIDGIDYHEETLPYALDGCVVIMYSLDGDMPSQQLDDYLFGMALQREYRTFMRARAGLVNARNALEFALARLPQVDPSKIYSAGHSSAGTLSLQLAATQPKLAGSIAYAPVSDLHDQLGDISDDPQIAPAFEDIGEYVKAYSPIELARKVRKPLFLFHAADDSNVPVSHSVQLAHVLRTEHFLRVQTGDHYDSMINEGIPAARAWLRQQTAL